MPEFPVPAEFELRDPLHDVTRKERKFLLGLSLIAVILVETDAFPTKVSALGLELSNVDHNIFIQWFILLIAYASIAFLFYAIVDFISWRKHWKYRRKGLFQPSGLVNQKTTYEVKTWQPGLAFLGTVIIRACIDFLFPLLFGAYSINILAKALN